MWDPPNSNIPVDGQAIVAAWGLDVMTASTPLYPSKGALDAGWTDAPEGASAHVVDTRRTYERRGGAWLLPLSNVQGAAVRSAPGPYNTSFGTVVGSPGVVIPGTTGTSNPFALPAFGLGPRGQRTYAVTMQARFVCTSGAPTNPAIHLLIGGTGADIDNEWDGGITFPSQVVFDAAFSCAANGHVIQQTWTGPLITGGTADQALTLQGLITVNNTTAAMGVSACTVTLLDMGPAS